METINNTLVESLKIIEPAATVEQSLTRILKAQAEEKRRAVRSLIKYFQQRYEMTVEEFYQARISEKKHTWEEEDTYFDWVAAHQELQEIESEIEKFENNIVADILE
jgi:hypothetical protein